MASEVKTYNRVSCDAGCGAYVDGDTAADARSKASDAGWSFPHKLKLDGTKAKRRHDVCPICSEEFAATLSPTSAKWRDMPADERRLRMLLQTNRFLLSREERARLDAELEAMEQKRLGTGPPTNAEAAAWVRGDG